MFDLLTLKVKVLSSIVRNTLSREARGFLQPRWSRSPSRVLLSWRPFQEVCLWLNFTSEPTFPLTMTINATVSFDPVFLLSSLMAPTSTVRCMILQKMSNHAMASRLSSCPWTLLPGIQEFWKITCMLGTTLEMWCFLNRWQSTQNVV